MRVILSRKGFDSKTGGAASPILDGKFMSIPIPGAESNIFYKDLYWKDKISYLKVMKDLNIKHFSEAHLDPDLRKSAYKERHPDWRVAFGQCEAQLSPLNKEGVAEGDLFLFFGWFKHVGWQGGKAALKK